MDGPSQGYGRSYQVVWLHGRRHSRWKRKHNGRFCEWQGNRSRDRCWRPKNDRNHRFRFQPGDRGPARGSLRDQLPIWPGCAAPTQKAGCCACAFACLWIALRDSGWEHSAKQIYDPAIANRQDRPQFQMMAATPGARYLPNEPAAPSSYNSDWDAWTTAICSNARHSKGTRRRRGNPKIAVTCSAEFLTAKCWCSSRLSTVFRSPAGLSLYGRSATSVVVAQCYLILLVVDVRYTPEASLNPKSRRSRWPSRSLACVRNGRADLPQ